MARNFGVPRQIDRHERTPVWPMWLVTFAIKIGIINAAKFPYHRCPARDFAVPSRTAKRLPILIGNQKTATIGSALTITGSTFPTTP